MTIHSLGGTASVEVVSVTASFGSTVPIVQRVEDNSRILKYSKPDSVSQTAKVSFKFTTKNVPQDTAFGIKQFIRIDSHSHTLKGLKSIDGRITTRFRGPKTGFILDVSANTLTVLFQPNSGVPTGARATAPHAPFFSEGPAFVRPSSLVELSIIDSPGGAIPLELRNVATDRINYLDSIDIRQVFLTVLTAVNKDKVHTPLEAVLWRQRVEGNVTWDNRGQPDISKVTAVNTGDGTFPNIDQNFLFADFNFLANASLTVADCMVQRYNDALFTVQGMYKQQNFTTATKLETRLESKGYELVQFPLSD